MSGWYAVKVGKIPGIYTSWSACQNQTNGYSGSIFKKFAKREDALEYFYDGKVPEHERNPMPITALRTKEPPLPVMAIEISTPKEQFVEAKILPSVLNQSNHEDTVPYLYPTVNPPRVTGKKYLEYDRSILNTPKYQLVIYIDGSKRPTVNHRGSGAYCRFNSKDFGLTVPFTAAVGSKYLIKPEDYDLLSSPTLEYLALGEVLWRFIHFKVPEVNGVSQPLNPRLKITFVADYIGVKCWTEGTWNAEKDYIQKIRHACVAVIDFLKKKGVDIEIIHCDGHVGILGNEMSDIMAKSTVYYDTFTELVKELSSSFLF